MIVIALYIAGCATISPEAENVVLHTQISNFLDDCEKLGPVKVKMSTIGQPSWDIAMKQAENDLRQVAYDQYKADNVAKISQELDKTRNTIVVHGIAFDCYK